MTRCQTCNQGFPDAYAIQRRAGDGKLECIDCCIKREEQERIRSPHPVMPPWDGGLTTRRVWGMICELYQNGSGKAVRWGDVSKELGLNRSTLRYHANRLRTSGYVEEAAGGGVIPAV